MALHGRDITVVGAGVAGLAVATACARRGARVEVLEQAPEITEVGAGLQISPNGAAVLAALGQSAALAAAGLPARAVALRNGTDGALVLRLDLARAGHRAGYHLLHRADLIALLEAAARAAGVVIRTGQRVRRMVPGAGGPRLELAAGGARRGGSVVIGADGLHSVVRAALGPAAAPDFTGQVAWRAVIPAAPDDRADPVAQVFMGPGRHLVSYPLRGGRLRNLVAVEERAAWVAEGWNHGDDPAALRAAFAGFGGPVPGWLAAVETVWLWGLFRHPVAERWQQAWDNGTGCAILGDAAHPTLPFLAQGANMALEDAWVLADMLDRHHDLAAALAAYQGARRGRCARIVGAANRNARAYHLSGLPRVLGHAGLRLASRLAPGLPLRRFDWLYGHDVTATPGG